ncbi:hypothetical protein IJ847_00580 [Candidatus Saccharibacteria bacterium]|nr:hypothetical protein [Candidatus Saccharibacteria bacterium]
MGPDSESANNQAEQTAQNTAAPAASNSVQDFNPVDYDPITNPENANGPMPQSPHNASFVAGDIPQYQKPEPTPEPVRHDANNAMLDYDPINGNMQIHALIANSPNIQTEVEEKPAEEEAKPEPKEQAQEEEAPLQVITVPGKENKSGKIILIVIAAIAVLGTIAALYFAFATN